MKKCCCIICISMNLLGLVKKLDKICCRGFLYNGRGDWVVIGSRSVMGHVPPLSTLSLFSYWRCSHCSSLPQHCTGRVAFWCTMHHWCVLEHCSTALVFCNCALPPPSLEPCVTRSCHVWQLQALFCVIPLFDETEPWTFINLILKSILYFQWQHHNISLFGSI